MYFLNTDASEELLGHHLLTFLEGSRVGIVSVAKLHGDLVFLVDDCVVLVIAPLFSLDEVKRAEVADGQPHLFLSVIDVNCKVFSRFRLNVRASIGRPRRTVGLSCFDIQGD